MATQLPLRRAQLPKIPQCVNQAQKRNASLLRRPHRPYTFTQMVTLSDGSTYLTRTTSPQPIYKSTKDTRNHLLWQPSMASLHGVEQDEAGKLRAFRARFGRGWDMEVEASEEEGGKKKGKGEAVEDSLLNLISGAGESLEARQKARAQLERDLEVAAREGEGEAEVQTRMVKGEDGKLVRVAMSDKTLRRDARVAEKKGRNT